MGDDGVSVPTLGVGDVFPNFHCKNVSLTTSDTGNGILLFLRALIKEVVHSTM